MTCSQDTLKKIEEAYWELEDALCIPDINRTECICEVCQVDVWTPSSHADDCELMILRKAIKNARNKS
jgi:hypothetical protein